MVYATKQQMIDHYGADDMVDVTDRATPRAGVIDDNVLNQALTTASAMIDSFVARRYNLPLSPVPALLVPVCRQIAFYNLLRGRYTEEARKEYEDALGILGKIASGDIVLDVGGKEPQSAPAQIVSEDTDRAFSRKERWY